MNSLPLVSIALCIYNGEKYLREQIDSLLTQTYTNIEIIAVDDCSNDASMNIVKEYKSPKIKIYENHFNLGFIKNFEKCIHLCSGDYIALCDQDDIWDAEKIEKLVDRIGENLLIYSDSVLIDENGKNLNIKVSSKRNFYKGKDFRPFVYSNCVSGHSMMISKVLKQYLFPFPEKVFHDWWIAYVASSLGSINYINESLVYYRQHSNNQTDFLDLKEEKNFTNNKTASRIQGVNEFILWLEVLLNYQYNNSVQKLFLTKLKNYYQNKLINYFSFGFLFFLLQHLNKLFYFTKKSFFSKVNLGFQISIGIKTKIVFDRSYQKNVNRN